MPTQKDEHVPQSDPSPPLKTHEISNLDHLLQNPIRLPQRYDLTPQKPLKKCSILCTCPIISIASIPQTKEELIESTQVRFIWQPRLNANVVGPSRPQITKHIPRFRIVGQRVRHDHGTEGQKEMTRLLDIYQKKTTKFPTLILYTKSFKS
jgi:hypothetical protein